MRYVSTRGGAAPVSFSAALMQGIAPDGGLYVPAQWPRFDARAAPDALPVFAAALLETFVADDPLADQLAAITADAFSFPAPLNSIDGHPAQVLELFHGPTAAFKDFGARFLAACQARVPRAEGERPLHILVATSGDTGGAVASAFHGRPGVQVSVLYPKGMVSPAQERQLTCWGGNVHAFAVHGAFDDCQRLVKEAFVDSALSAKFALSSANSINVARLLPQMTYFAATSLAIWNEHGAPASFVIPSGNLGHATACLWARKLGLPIDQIVLAHNANRTMPDYLTSGEWRPRATIPTLASAMDVGDPSNGERLRHLYPNLAELRCAVTAYVVDDEAIRARIRTGWEQHAQIWCPHTAAAAEAFARHTQDGAVARRWVIVATAHPAKFPEIVEPIIGQTIPVPPALAALPPAGSPTEIEPRLATLRQSLLLS
ncbi:threonine synthase [Terricaulis silvestris]|uniref:Threonine synthase n=1 Tax=Terricaulis silvestris TaxID=2686094 RepID=A0A6I6MN25_9CAUL|nr:threonine synthase [Terricaulis silvestris]QGZ96089.1 Threonine synthase [Terricaulis silvestris]